MVKLVMTLYRNWCLKHNIIIIGLSKAIELCIMQRAILLGDGRAGVSVSKHAGRCLNKINIFTNLLINQLYLCKRCPS